MRLNERILPQAIEAEGAVLGSMLRSAEVIAIVQTKLKPIHFYSASHRLIFEAISDVWALNNTVDLVLLADHLDRRGQLEKVGGAAYLATLEEIGTPANVEYYAALVRDRAFLRSLAATCSEVEETVCESSKPAEEMRTWAEQKMFAVFQQADMTGPVEISGPIREAMNLVDAIQQGKKSLNGISSPWNDLDLLTCGWQASTLYVVAGRPSMGKTSFAMNVVEHASVHQQIPTLVFSLETSRQILALNMICSKSRVNPHRIRRGNISNEEIPKMTDSAGYIYNAPIIIDDTPGLSIFDIRSRARLAKMRKKIGLIVIDYIQLVECPKEYPNENREQTVARISKNVKDMCRELEIPVLVLAQLNRMPDAREDHRPRLSDLRESGSIEQDADCVIGLHREGYYNARKKGGVDTPESEVIILKQRNGPIGTVKTMFLKEILRFEQLSKQTESHESDDARYV